MIKTKFNQIYIPIICFFTLLVQLGSNYAAAGDCDPWMAKVVSVEGVVQARKAHEKDWREVKQNDTFCQGDCLRVLEKSRAAVVLSNEAIARLDQKTTITFSGIEEKKVSIIDLIKGAAHFFSREPRSLKITTPFVNGAVEGTEFYVRVNDEKTFLSVFRGRVLASNESGSLSLGSNQSALAHAGKAPVSHVVVSPRDAVKWALYYPAVFVYRSGDIQKIPASKWQGIARKSIQYYHDGDLAGAIKCLADVTKDIRDPGFYTFRASLLLSVGRVDEAEADIERALGLDTLNSRAWALKSIIAVSQNRKHEALALAEKAMEQDSDAFAARIALSYVQQAHFQIRDALENLEQAVASSPANALAQARLAELLMAAGDLDKALEAAQNAARLNPGLERTQTVLGFAYLAQIKTKDAKAAFNKAVALDQAAPLPRLGLGLAKIREGELKPGRVEIEIAAGLSPNDSLIRSYLGKAFFDEKRDKQSDSQLAFAKELDPQDPTPWFYDAIRKQTLNRPVEALQDLQKSIVLNDSRAVYRSRFLLDEDLAVRSASLARIYGDLGFEQLALVEGWKSVNTDPSSYSAHRFLADSYAALPRHEIARVSELLQSQLLQPININPVQPHLGESETYIYEGAGPADLSFNEFNPLFLRNRLALQASGVVGGNDTYGDELVQSGVWGKLSYSVGQFHYETDGFRINNGLEEDIYNVFFQASLTHKTSVQAEYRYRDTENGDLSLRFDPDDFDPDLQEEEKSHTLRLGSHHAFTSHSDLIVSLIYRRLDYNLDIPSILKGSSDVDAYMGEIQHLFRAKKIHLTTGAGYFNSEAELKSIPPLENVDIDHTNLYVYSMIDLPKDWTWTAGASTDFFEGGQKDRDQFNPKFGVTWNPIPETTLRGAVFRTFQRSLPSQQTLEPTQVAGFNQFFDDPEGADSWVYGLGIDQVFSSSVYGGVEFSRREIEFPFYSFVNSQIKETQWTDDLGRIYLYWTPYRTLALSSEYQYEELDRSSDAPGLGNDTELETHHFPLKIFFFHPSGFNARIKATYIEQDGEFSVFMPPNSSMTHPDDDQFWVIDAAIGYRLPKRYGLITIEARNLLDEEFKYQDTDPANPRIALERLVIARVTFSF